MQHYQLEDMVDAPVEIGDYLIDPRGHLLQARRTDYTVAKEKVLYTYTISLRRGQPYPTEEGYIHKGFCLKVDPSVFLLSSQERVAIWQAAWQQVRGPQVSEELRQHRELTNIRRRLRGVPGY